MYATLPLGLVTSANGYTTMSDPAMNIDVLQAMETNFQVCCYAAAAGARPLPQPLLRGFSNMSLSSVDV